jgi:hypothetical protein
VRGCRSYAGLVVGTCESFRSRDLECRNLSFVSWSMVAFHRIDCLPCDHWRYWLLDDVGKRGRGYRGLAGDGVSERVGSDGSDGSGIFGEVAA